MALLKWKKKDGTEIETNDLPKTVKLCESLGWKRVSDVKPGKEKKEKSREPEAAE